jgi:voltage-gated potassium channel
MPTQKLKSKKVLTTSRFLLLFFTIITIFILPFFPIVLHHILYSICYTILFLLSVTSIEKAQSRLLIIALIVVAVEWISEISDMLILHGVSLILNILFFDLIVILFIYQIVRAKKVTHQVLVESVIAYLLLGLSFAIMIALISVVDETAFSFAHLTEPMVEGISYVSNYIYYGFVTLTTLGYGDVVPLTPAAKSFSILTAITGQLYVAIIIATLVSKYLGQKNSN